MLRFQASAVECFSDFEEVLTVHFGDGAAHYLALQVWVEGYEKRARGTGMIHVEVDDQRNSGYDRIARAELTRGSFRVDFDGRDPALAPLGGVEVTFELAPDAFEQLRVDLKRVFRKHAAYRDRSNKRAKRE